LAEDTVWICITAIAIVGILGLVFVMIKQPGETGVTYSYDDKNRLKAVTPIKKVNLRPVE